MYKNYPLIIYDKEFSVDLIALPFHEFDLILGMDWLSKHRDIVDCDKKTVVVKCFDLLEVVVHGIQSGPVSELTVVLKSLWSILTLSRILSLFVALTWF